MQFDSRRCGRGPDESGSHERPGSKPARSRGKDRADRDARPRARRGCGERPELPAALGEARLAGPAGALRGAGGSGQRRLRDRGEGVRREAASVRRHQAHVPAPGRDLGAPQAVRARSAVGRGRPPRECDRHLRRRGPAHPLSGHGLHRRANLAAEARRDRSAGADWTCSASAGKSPPAWPRRMRWA